MKKVFLFLRDCVELYIPIAALLIMFCTFVFQIFSRYILNSPVPWAYEVTVMCYLWMVVLGACYAYRDRSHVTFTLFYDQFGTKAKAFIAFLGNVLMLIAFAYMFLPTCDMILDQMSKQVTSVFKIGLNIVYFPFIPFMIIIMLYIISDIFVEFMVFTGLGGEKYEQKMLSMNKTEVEEVVELSKVQEEKGGE
jgi:TRAP-type C4-dicarboxylate transport system permease small subunit